ncbi:MAG: hypothetical protein J5775_02490 [Spirochaetales bacterium]|nr:hypothetical protein [Spirochaetales bacterium]
MKKAVAVLAVILAVFAVFAAKADMKVGAQLGYGAEREYASDEGKYASLDYSGFRISGTFEYGFADSLYAKASVGIATLGQGRYVFNPGAAPFSANTTDAPVNFGVYLGAEYSYDIGESFRVSGGLGFDALLGKMWTLGSIEYGETSDAVFNARMGIAGEVTGSYRIDKDLAVNLGGRFAWHFYDSDKYNTQFKKEAGEAGWSWIAFSYDFFAGLTFSL